MTEDNSIRPQKRFKLSRRTVAIIGAVAFVVLLAGVIYGLSAVGPAKDSEPALVQLTPEEEESAQLTEEGLEALASGDTSAAASLFAQAASLDPSNERARDELAKITVPVDDANGGPNGSSGGAGGGGGGAADGGSGGDDSVWLEPVDDITKLLPSSVSGYELSLVTALGPDATVSADPTEDGPRGKVVRALYSVHDAETGKQATAFVKTVPRTAFPKNYSEITVDGVSAYFGTDGTRFASVAFARGRYAFQVILTTDGGSPGALLDLAVQAAQAFPDTP